MTHHVRCPCSRLVFVTGRTSVRDLVFLCHCWRDELESVCAHEGAGDALGLDLRHMAGYALTPWAAVLVMSMKLHAGYVWTIRRRCTVAVEADLVNGLTKLRIVFGPVYVVARCAGDALPVHHALHKVIALHPIFVSGPIRKMSESRLPQCVIFEFPVVRQAETGAVTNGPVVSLPSDLLRKRLSLGVTRDTSVIRSDIVHLRRIEDISTGGMGNVFAAWTVTAFAAYVPLGDLFGVNVITDGVAAVAGRSGRTLHVVGWVVRSPPICSSVWYVVGPPCFIADVPLSRKWIVVISYF